MVPAHSAHHPAADPGEHTACTVALLTPDLVVPASRRSRLVVHLRVATVQARRYQVAVVVVRLALVAARCLGEGCRIGIVGAGREPDRAKWSGYDPRSLLGSTPSSCMCWQSGGC